MAFLAPALLAGLLAIAIPIVVHLVQRERKRVVAFPSLMFLRKIPNQAVRRRAIRHWPLLMLRILALALIAMAFARPFFPSGRLPASAAAGSRDVVILLDRSASMGYGDHWARARSAAANAARSLGPGDRATLVLFAADAEVSARSDAGPAALVAAIDRASPGFGSTRLGPALRAAAGLLASSEATRREIVLVSDFQKSGWDPTQDVRLPPGVTVTPVSVADPATSNLALAGLSFDRRTEAGSERVTVSARLVNRGAKSVADREISLDVDGHREDARRVSLAPESTATTVFTPFIVAGRSVRVTVRLADDALRADDRFYAVVRAGGRVPVLVVESPSSAPGSSLYLGRALDVGGAPGFDTRVVAVDRLEAGDISTAAVIILNDTRPPSGAAARALQSAVQAGAGLLVALGERSTWSSDDPDLLPGSVGAVVDRAGTLGGRLGFVDFSHPVFEIFGTPRSGDLTAARVFRYRGFTNTGRVLARFDDGQVAMAERRVGRGTVMVWTSSLDSYWNDFPLKPVFVPFVHQAMKHLGRYVEPKAWYTVGEVFDPAGAPPIGPRVEPAAAAPLTALTPAGRGVELSDAGRPGTLVLAEAGFYEIRTAGREKDAANVAVNVAPAESDLAPLDPAELVGAVTAGGGRAGGARPRDVTVEELERQQSIWWYLLATGLLLLAIEAVVASRLPRIA